MLQSEQFSAHLLRRTKEDDKKDLTRTGLSIDGLSTDGLIVLRRFGEWGLLYRLQHAAKVALTPRKLIRSVELRIGIADLCIFQCSVKDAVVVVLYSAVGPRRYFN